MEHEDQRKPIMEEVMEREREEANWPGKEKYQEVVDEIGVEIDRYQSSGKPINYNTILDGTTIADDADWYEKIRYYASYYYTRLRTRISDAIDRIQRR